MRIRHFVAMRDQQISIAAARRRMQGQYAPDAVPGNSHEERRARLAAVEAAMIAAGDLEEDSSPLLQHASHGEKMHCQARLHVWHADVVPFKNNKCLWELEMS